MLGLRLAWQGDGDSEGGKGDERRFEGGVLRSGSAGSLLVVAAASPSLDSSESARSHFGRGGSGGGDDGEDSIEEVELGGEVEAVDETGETTCITFVALPALALRL